MMDFVRTRDRLLVTFVVCLAAAVGLPGSEHAREAASSHVHGKPATEKTPGAAPRTNAPRFILTDQDGRNFDSARLRGKIVVLDFIYTTCTDVCPLFTANFASLQRRLPAERKNQVYFVSITTDPEIDSPKVLKAYAQRYGADFANWAFLTGTDAQLNEVWKGFGIRVIHKGRGLVQHDSLTTLIDREGRRRFNHLGESWRISDVENDLERLLAESANGQR